MNGKDLQPDYSEEARRRHHDAEVYEALDDVMKRPGGEPVLEDVAGRLRLTFRRWRDHGRNILVSGRYADSLSIIAAVIALAQEVLK